MGLPGEEGLCPRPQRHLLPELAASGPPHDHRSQPLQMNPVRARAHRVHLQGLAPVIVGWARGCKLRQEMTLWPWAEPLLPGEPHALLLRPQVSG